MAQAKNPLGPVGRRVARTVEELRGRLHYRELSARLALLGRNVPVLGLSRIERFERRVDVDDLVALAIALGTTPTRLMLPRDNSPGTDVALTSEVTVPANLAWSWARGDAPLEPWMRGVIPDGATPDPDIDVEAFRQAVNPKTSSPAGGSSPAMMAAASAVVRVLAEEAERSNLDPLVLLDVVISWARHPSNPEVGSIVRRRLAEGQADDGS